ncbi:hypothetical protein E2C01_044674 [Portunus trituberculatus]|uniref:Uncharacterized protein n=1 Tax=Portunus trituberculatus TaxID=210409 RepID=A0A5B7FTR6_PORTR|nr:hypothetical protein [Portunus trituberculatus]
MTPRTLATNSKFCKASCVVSRECCRRGQVFSGLRAPVRGPVPPHPTPHHTTPHCHTPPHHTLPHPSTSRRVPRPPHHTPRTTHHHTTTPPRTHVTH